VRRLSRKRKIVPSSIMSLTHQTRSLKAEL
jgi:hypothetical protein